MREKAEVLRNAGKLSEHNHPAYKENNNKIHNNKYKNVMEKCLRM